jgi:hypothetical protein
MTENFVPAEKVAEFLGVGARRVKELARRGVIPAYPVCLGKKRLIWRFRLSEIERALVDKQTGLPSRASSAYEGSQAAKSNRAQREKK